jgi:hypothetical protein
MSADFRRNDLGFCVAFRPLSDIAHLWIDENLGKLPFDTMNDAIICDTCDADRIAQEITEQQLTIEE